MTGKDSVECYEIELSAQCSVEALGAVETGLHLVSAAGEARHDLGRHLSVVLDHQNSRRWRFCRAFRAQSIASQNCGMTWLEMIGHPADREHSIAAAGINQSDDR